MIVRTPSLHHFRRGLSSGVFSRSQLSGFSPLKIPSLASWYDISDLSILRNNAGAVPSNGDSIKLIGDKSGNSGVNVLASGGAASNTATAPNVSTTGNQTFSFDVLFPDYTPGSNLTLVDKLSGNNGFQILLLTTGVLRLRVGDGAAVTNVDSTTGLTITDLTRGQFQVIWTDGVGASFTQNGSALGTAVAAVKTLTNAAVSITLWTSTPGVFYSFTCGTYTFNPSGAAKLSGTFVAPTTGETWTINTSGDLGARICGARDLYQGTAANQPTLTVSASGNYLTFDGVNDYMKAAAWSMAQPETVYFAGSQVSWTSADKIFTGNTSATNNNPQVFQTGSTPSVSLFAGNTAAANTGWALNTTAILCAVFNGVSSSSRINRLAASTGNAGTQGGNGFTLGGEFDGSVPGNITVSEILIYNAAHDTAAQNRIIAYLGYKWGIAV